MNHDGLTPREVLQRLGQATGLGLRGLAADACGSPAPTDVDATAWMPDELIPKPGVDYFDVYDYKYVMEQRQPIAKFYAGLKS
jgi:hypothetical protein